MVSVGVQVTTIKTRVSEIFIQSLFLPQKNPRVVLSQPIAIPHLTWPGFVHQLNNKKSSLLLEDLNSDLRSWKNN